MDIQCTVYTVGGEQQHAPTLCSKHCIITMDCKQRIVNDTARYIKYSKCLFYLFNYLDKKIINFRIL